jgi:rSAM/selenodomain-associated transferase 1
MPTRANALAIMAKAPVPGTVKTRLVPPLTHEQAAELYRALLLDQLEHLSAFNAAELYVAFTPDEAAGLIKSLAPAGFHCFPQRGADLGARMNEVFAELRRRGHRSSVIIGSDLPPVPLDTFVQAFAQLSADGKRVVLAPTRDGGYYLVGMNQPVPEIFSGITWSDKGVLKATIDRLTQRGIDFGLLPEWFDVDTVEDLEHLRAISDLSVRDSMPRTLAGLLRIDGIGCSSGSVR